MRKTYQILSQISRNFYEIVQILVSVHKHYYIEENKAYKPKKCICRHKALLLIQHFIEQFIKL